MSPVNIDWKKKNILKLNNQVAFCSDDQISEEDALKHRSEVEPWLSAIFQSEHFSVLLGSGFTTAICYEAGIKPQQMARIEFKHKFNRAIHDYADKKAKTLDRGEANIEDDIRTTNELLNGLEILDDLDSETLKAELNEHLRVFINHILAAERELYQKLLNQEDSQNYIKALEALTLLKSFLISFSSRSASRERLNIFTTNYDRFIELGADEAGILMLDRFKGKMRPIFRNTRLELDIHYNPPGIRGEPRYIEGVARITKIHGSIDWSFDNRRVVRKLLPFGAQENHPEIPADLSDKVVIYPNSSKDIETAFYPYAELFRDFSFGICKPNSVLVTFGYGFGDSHINRVIEDMLTIPSTHLVIIAYDRADETGNFGSVRDRIKRFYERVGNSAQFTILLGEHFGSLPNLVNYYLPKSAIDKLTIKKQSLLVNRGEAHQQIDQNTKPDSTSLHQ